MFVRCGLLGGRFPVVADQLRQGEHSGGLSEGDTTVSG